MGPLAGLKVLDFSTLLPGPMATLFLAEAGATVVKIEPPGRGEDMRHYPPPWGGQSASFALLNRAKGSLALDLKDPAQRAALTPLLAEADILVEQFRPGVMARLGLDHDSLKARHPRLIYCSITGYGQSGPKAGTAGHDLNYLGDSGLLALSLGDPARPTVPPALVADIAGGSYPALVNILLALLQRARTGNGCHLDIAMCDGLFPFAFWAWGQGQATGDWPGNGDGLLTGGSPRYQLYPTADGRVVAAAPLEDKFWRTFCKLIGVAETADIATVGTVIAGETAEHWRAVFTGRDCCCSVVATLEEALQDPQFRQRGLFDRRLANADGQTMPALPLPLAPHFRDAPEQDRAAPVLGQDNEDCVP